MDLENMITELLEQSELDAWHLMQRYDLDMPMPEIHYNRKFAVTDLASGIAGLLQLSEIPAGKAYHRAIGKTAVELLANLGGVGNEEKNRIINEIKEDKNNESEKYHTETAQ